MLGRRFDCPIELRLSRLICVQKIFQKAARPRFEVFAIKRNFPPLLTLLGFKPAKHRSTPMTSQLGRTLPEHQSSFEHQIPPLPLLGLAILGPLVI